MSLAQRLREIRSGFEPAFWIANLTELFERLAYYATAAVLAIYLNEQLHFSSELTGWLIGTFGLVVWFLPILGGTLADRFGFRRALMFAYLVMTVGYFLLGRSPRRGWNRCGGRFRINGWCWRSCRFRRWDREW